MAFQKMVFGVSHTIRNKQIPIYQAVMFYGKILSKYCTLHFESKAVCLFKAKSKG